MESGFFGRGNKHVGTFYVSRDGSRFHSRIDCSTLASDIDVSEVSIVLEGDGTYVLADQRWSTKQTRRTTLTPCSRCKPLEGGMSVEPLGSTDIPCYERDREWVFHIRSNANPDKIYDVQKECILNCPLVEECFDRFLEEQPVYGVLGGVTYQQYRKYGKNTLAVMRGKVYENQKAVARKGETGASGGSRRDAGGRS